jgi:predicted ATPase
LIAKEKSFIVIENPEAHLHPAAQAAMGKFLATMSHAGLNIIVETHSDHIIEGIQLYVADNPKWHDCVTINCFGKKDGENQPDVESITFDEKAVFSGWPEGFMDQSQIDFSELRKIRKKHE